MPNPPNVSAAYQRFEAGVHELEERFNAPVPDIPPYSESCPPVHDDSKLFLVILLQNTWADFSKNLVELSVLGRGPTLSGRALTPVPTPADAESLDSHLKKTRTSVAQSMSNKQGHPTWHIPAYTARLSEALKPDNDYEIQLGLGAIPEIGYLNTVRNHIVHGDRNREYAQIQAQYSVRDLSVPKFLISNAGAGESIFQHWVSRLLMAARVGAR